MIATSPPSRASTLLVIAFATISSTSSVLAEKRPRPVRQPTRSSPHSGDAQLVTISYPDSVSLAAFIDYVSQSLGTRILYGDEVKNQSVIFRPSEVEVPKAQLMDLLRSMLRMRDLAVVEGDLEGWLRIVNTGDMQRHVSNIRDGIVDLESPKSNQVITQIVPVTSEDLGGIVQHAKRFLSSPNASVIEVPERKLLIITDYESAIARAVEIIKLIDVGSRSVKIRNIPARHVDPTTLAGRVTPLLTEKAKQQGRKGTAVTLQPDPSTNEILLIGSDDGIVEAATLLEQMDIPSEIARKTTVYAPRFMSAQRLKQLIEQVVLTESTSPRGGVKLFLDEDANRCFVTASDEVHRRIGELLGSEDIQAVESSRPLRVYKPSNRSAQELIGTLSEVLPNVEKSTSPEPNAGLRPDRAAPPGPNRPPGPPAPVQFPPPPPSVEPDEAAPLPPSRVTRLQGRDFVLSYDEPTNAILAIGPREFHAELQRLIEALDRRQAQVLIEMTLIAVTFNDSLSIAIELLNEEENSGYQSLLFSSFGLSQVNLANGIRGFSPGGGINGVIMGPQETPVLFRAIAAHGNSRIMTTPQIIVSDGTTATIGNVEEQPFTSLNASNTVATTTFAGFESAGTTLTVTPHIAAGDHLSLDYSFNFSNFTGSGSVGVPPPRTTNTFSGTVAIPDGHTIIVGGLVTENESDSVTEVPLLGRIPGIGALFQSSDRVRTKSRVYAFIKPTVLRDDQFADLKLISRRALERASIKAPDYPPDEFVWMR